MSSRMVTMPPRCKRSEVEIEVGGACGIRAVEGRVPKRNEDDSAGGAYWATQVSCKVTGTLYSVQLRVQTQVPPVPPVPPVPLVSQDKRIRSFPPATQLRVERTSTVLSNCNSQAGPYLCRQAVAIVSSSRDEICRYHELIVTMVSVLRLAIVSLPHLLRSTSIGQQRIPPRWGLTSCPLCLSGAPTMALLSRLSSLADG